MCTSLLSSGDPENLYHVLGGGSQASHVFPLHLPPSPSAVPVEEHDDYELSPDVLEQEARRQWGRCQFGIEFRVQLYP